ncbi:MAG: hypothetical protein LBC41_06060, partial [Clostridiales bacterium]|nr:hypothetical protein [Clostridiales bacterium]
IAKYELEMAGGKNSQSLSLLWFKLGQDKKKKKKTKKKKAKKKADKPLKKTGEAEPAKAPECEEAKESPPDAAKTTKTKEKSKKASKGDSKKSTKGDSKKSAKDDSDEKPKKTFKEKVQGLKDKWDMIADFPLKEELLNEVGKLLKRLLKPLIPKGLEGDLEFGFDDPSLTGRVLGALYFATGLAGFRNFRFRADFEKTMFNADLKAWGRISLWSLTWPVLAACLSKPGKHILIPLIFKNRKDVGHEQQLEQQS